MSVAVSVSLSQNGSRCVFGCVAFDLEGSGLICHYKDRFFCELFFEAVKAFLGFVGPFEFRVFLEEFVEGFGQFGEFVDESSVEVSKSQEGSDLFHGGRDWPISDPLEL